MADFVLGRLKFKWRGDWAVSTAYLIDDIVKYGGNTYVCISNHSSQSTIEEFYTDLTARKWQLHGESFYFKGAYANATWYKFNDLVRYGQRQYRCTTQHTSASTVLDESKFELYQDVVDYKGDWAATTYYKVNDIVKNGAGQFRCILAHTSAGTFAIGSNWQVYTEGLQWEDTYNPSTTYQDGDVVNYGGYTYVYINATPAAGQTPTDNTYWDVLTTGFKALGDYSHGVTYKTGDTVKYGGNNYVCIANHANQYPSNTDGTVNSSYWTLNIEGFNYRAAYNAATIYNIGDVVRLTATTYVAIQDRIVNVSPDSDGAKWQIVAQGDSGAVLSTRGDLLIQGAAASQRLPMGLPGGILTNDGTDILWSGISGGNVLWVSPSGDNSNPGTEALPYLTLAYAVDHAKSNSITEIDTIAGGTGGTPAVYDDVTGTASREFTVASVPDTSTITINMGTSTHAHTYVDGGTIRKTDDSTLDVLTATYVHGTGVITIAVPGSYGGHGISVGHKVKLSGLNYTCSIGAKTYPEVGSASAYRITTDGSSIPTVEVINGGADHNVGDSIHITGAQLGSSSALTFNVKSVAGDIIRLKNGTFKEQLPLRVRKNVSIVGESLRNTRLQPATGTGTQIATVELTNNISGATNGTYEYIHASNVEKPFTVASVPDATSFTINLGTSAFAHTYNDGGVVTLADYTTRTITDAPYNNSTGVITITVSASHGLSVSDTVKLSGLKYSCLEGDKTYPKVGQGSVWTVVVEGGIATGVLTYHGGSGFSVGDVVTVPSANIGGGGDLTLTVKKLEDNNASNIFLTNEKNNLRNMTFTGLSGTKRSGGLYKVTVVDSDTFTIALATSAYAHTYVSGGSVIKVGDEGNVHLMSSASYAHGTGVLTINTATAHGLSTNDYATIGKMKFTCDLGEKIYPASGPYQQAIVSLDPSGNISFTSPYIQNCTSINAGACGVQVDGNLHKNTFTSSYKSILANDFTQINSDGIGVHVIGAGRAETVSVFTYYCDKANYAESGGFIRALNCSHSYGEKGVVASGTDASESPVQVTTRGMMLKYDQTAFGGGATEADIDNAITYDGSGTATIAGAGGATARLFRKNISLNYLHIDNIVGNFVQGETITITKEDTSTFTVNLDASFGDSTAAQKGQIGPLIAVKAGQEFTVATVPDATSFTINMGTSAFAHTYVSGGTVTKADDSVLAVSDAPYVYTTGVITITTPTHGLSVGDKVVLKDLGYTCSKGAKTYPTSSLATAGVLKVANNLKFPGDNNYYRIGLVSEENTTNETATVRLTASIELSEAKVNDVVAKSTADFSNIRLTGHDFLNIGTGDITTTNYPGIPTQLADQEDEVTEENGGRVYWVSTDQRGDFRVGDLFKIEQATGAATLNADAFNLSGLSELQLGSIGAELGATINEFSTDATLGGNSNTALPTENAVLGYMTKDLAGTGAWVPPTGTTAERPAGGALYTGALRYNATLVTWEGYNGSQWTGLGGGNPWQTHTADGSTALTVAANDRWFINTTAGALTVNLPASPLTGDQIRLQDLAGTFETNKVTIGRNTKKINGLDEDFLVSVEDASIGFVYTGATYGWKLLEVY